FVDELICFSCSSLPWLFKIGSVCPLLSDHLVVSSAWLFLCSFLHSPSFDVCFMVPRIPLAWRFHSVVHWFLRYQLHHLRFDQLI
ncbi:hypothetical protein M9458_013584, partial [Cirrhinus mrigala]